MPPTAADLSLLDWERSASPDSTRPHFRQQHLLNPSGCLQIKVHVLIVCRMCLSFAVIQVAQWLEGFAAMRSLIITDLGRLASLHHLMGSFLPL